MLENPRESHNGFDVVHASRALPCAAHRRERRLQAGLTLLAFERVNKSSFFTANVGACATVNKDIETELGAANVFAEVTGGVCLIQSLVQAFDAGQEFATAVDVGSTATESPSCNNQAFDQAVRIFHHQEVILKGTAFAFVSVHYNVHGLAGIARNKAPLHTGREACTATATQAGTLHVVNHFELAHVEQAIRNVRVAAQLLVDFNVLGALAKISCTNFYYFSHNYLASSTGAGFWVVTASLEGFAVRSPEVAIMR